MKIRLLALLTLAGLGIASATAQPSNAQIGVPSNQSTNPQNYDNSNDPFNQGVEQNNFGGIMGLIHRANFGGAGYNPEFFAEQSQQLDEAAAAFRARQQQRIQQGGVVQPSNQQGSQVIKLEPASGN
jgi:hypothetical protein